MTLTFLLEGQVMQVADATTPLRQLYFIVQLMLMNPHDVEEAKARLSGAAMRSGRRVREPGDAATVWRRSTIWSKRTGTTMPCEKIRTLFDVEQSILAGAELARSPIRSCLKARRTT